MPNLTTLLLADALSEQVSKAWSDEAREAALEARRGGSGGGGAKPTGLKGRLQQALSDWSKHRQEAAIRRTGESMRRSRLMRENLERRRAQRYSLD